jgi:hypothetical protein
MTGSSSLPRAIVALGSVVLIATAAFHASGYTAVAGALNRTALNYFLRGGLRGLWLMFSIQLVVVAILCLAVAWRPQNQTRMVIFFCCLLLGLETWLLYWSVGFFIGEVLLGVTLVCYLLAAILLKPERR